jgi:hypothetical protein
MAAFSMLSWELLARHRLVFGITAIYFALICFACPLLPGPWRTPNLAVPMVLPLVWSLTVAVASLAHAYGARLESRASSVPARQFTLPASSLLLAGAPLLTGALLCAACWPMLALAVLRPCGAEVPLLWPALLGAAFLAWAQALSWSPFPLAWLRLAVLAPLLPGLAFGGVALAHSFGEPPTAGALAALTLLAYAVALNGVARARRGAGTAEPARTGSIIGYNNERYTPFISTASAQLWLEWRLRRWGLFFAAGLALAGGLTATHLSSVVLNRGEILPVLPRLAAAVEAYGVGWLSVTGMLLLPILLGLLGADLGQLAPRRYSGVPLFFLALPTGTTALVRYKLAFAALLAAAAWLLVLAAGLVWAAATGHLPDMTERLIEHAGSRQSALVLAVAVPLLAGVVSWLWLAGGMWGGLPHRSEIAPLPLLVGIAELGLAVCAVRVWQIYPEARPWVAAGLVVALLLKAAAVAWVCRRLHVRRLAGPLALAVCVLAWVLFAAVVAGLVLPATRGGPAMAAAVLLLLPLARPLAAPLALHWARQR